MTNLLIKLFVKDAKNTKNKTVRYRYGTLASVTGVVLNFLLSFGKMLVGWLFSSISILADGINNLTDATSSIVTMIGFKISNRPADSEHPFGHERFEYISGLVVAFLVMILGLDLAKTSVGKIISPEPSIFGILPVAVLVVSIFVKLWMYLFNIKISRTIDSSSLKATATDCLNDVYATSAVLVSVIIAWTFDINLDGYMGLLVSIFILYSGVSLIKETLSPLLGRAPSAQFVSETMEKILSYDGVLGIHDLVVHDYGPNKRFASVHVETDYKCDIMESHDLTDRIERDFAKDGIHLVVHMDPIVTDDESVNELKKIVTDIVKGINERLSIHDFRAVVGPSHTNLIFDVATFADINIGEKELIEVISAKIKEKDEKYFAVINIDQHYVEI